MRLSPFCWPHIILCPKPLYLHSHCAPATDFDKELAPLPLGNVYWVQLVRQASLRKASTPPACRQMQVPLMRSLVSGPRGLGTTLRRRGLAKGWSVSPGGRVCEPDGRRRTEQRKEPKWRRRNVDLNERKDNHNCKGFPWRISSHFDDLISRHFLPKTDYFLNNDRGHYTNTPLNNVMPLSSDGGRTCAFPEDGTPTPSLPHPLSQGCYDG